MEDEWIIIELKAPGRLVDFVVAVLAEMGAGGTVIEDRQLDTFSVPDDELIADQEYALKAYFKDVSNPSGFREKLVANLSRLPALAAGNIVVQSPVEVQMKDWADDWKQNFSAIHIGSRLVIHPSWEDYKPEGEKVAIEIDPGMAFGTGTHGTTLLCLEMIAELFAGDHPPNDMLDVGTGSGILALGAAALGCNRVLANDIDPQACEVAFENVIKNHCDKQIEISSQPLEDLSGEFDLVVANILAEENVRLKDELSRHLRPGGWLVLSGILREKETMVREGFSGLPLESFPTRMQDDWVCMLYRRSE